MWLRDLIKVAQEALAENGNIPVAVYIDNSRGCVMAYQAGVVYSSDDGVSYLHTDLLEDGYDLKDYTKVFEIAGD